MKHVVDELVAEYRTELFRSQKGGKVGFDAIEEAISKSVPVALERAGFADLLAAAQTVIRDMEESYDDALWMSDLRMAVAKATGAEVPA